MIREDSATHALGKRNAPDHASGEAGAYGAHCSLGVDAGFADWTCQSGLACKKVDDEVLGRCLPAGAAA